MKAIFLIYSMVVLSLISLGQNETLKSFKELSIAVENANYFKKGVDIEGSPYKSENFTNAIFYQKNTPSFTSETRLNYFLSNFEFKHEDKLFILDPATIDSLKVNDQVYLFKTINFEGKTLPRIVELKGKSEKFILYEFTAVVFKPEVKAIGYVTPKPNTFEWYEPKYLIETGDKIIELSNWNKLLVNFPGKENEIKAFIKSGKIKKDNPADLLQLMQYLDKEI